MIKNDEWYDDVLKRCCRQVDNSKPSIIDGGELAVGFFITDTCDEPGCHQREIAAKSHDWSCRHEETYDEDRFRDDLHHPLCEAGRDFIARFAEKVRISRDRIRRMFGL
jgi:hypothetical protein